MKIHCLYNKLVPVSELKQHPDNTNEHTDEQIQRLSEILLYQGWRYPIKVSNQSGYITSGHARLMAAILNKWDSVPVNFQDYESSDQELADITSDNAIATWSILNYGKINSQLERLDGSTFNVKMFGLKDFLIEPAEKFDPRTAWEGMPEFNQEDQTAYRAIKVNFQNESGVNKFRELIGQLITDKTRSIWFPEVDRVERNSMVYQTEENES